MGKDMRPKECRPQSVTKRSWPSHDCVYLSISYIPEWVIKVRCLQSWDGVGFFDEMHVLDDSSLTVVLEFVLDAFLLNETVPVQFALADWVDLATSIVDGPHDVVEVLESDMCLSLLKLFVVLLWCLVLENFIVCLLFDKFELPCFFIQHELFACEYDSFARFERFTIQNILCQTNQILGSFPSALFRIRFYFFFVGEVILVFGFLVELLDGAGDHPWFFLFFLFLPIESFFLFGWVVVLIFIRLIVLEVLS